MSVFLFSVIGINVLYSALELLWKNILLLAKYAQPIEHITTFEEQGKSFTNIDQQQTYNTLRAS
jgi:hypothetical protein